MREYEINIDATWGNRVEASSLDQVWDENPELKKEVDILTARLSELFMVVDVLIEEGSDVAG
jgi:hypothetical protein